MSEWVFYAGTFYKVANYKKTPMGKMVGIYDEPPSNHVDYLNPANVDEVAHCHACQGEGCTVCGGFGLYTTGRKLSGNQSGSN